MRLRAVVIALATAVVAGLGWAFVRPVSSAPDPALAKYIVGTEKSGYVYLDPSTREMEDDDISNPGFLWVDKGKTLWNAVDGSAGKSCAACHGEAPSSMKGVAATYPKYDAKLGKVIDLEQRINLERTDRMGATPYKWESQQLLALTTYVKLQSRGMPVNVATGGPAHKYWLEGKQYFETRRGQLNMSCEQCHVEYADHQLRADTLSQGQTNGFPTYRLAWQAVGSVEHRFRACNLKIRAQPAAYGSETYVALELYVASRGEGLPIETPAVRK
ncbi:MAG TPA: sulfur oxidation c-type cytochrome SoxA [Candidatus Dormibacteraeota bacterium]|nr:sulfur oxidation c-type cytochrome SoxA [Candidatus Dormibacteraeota bacterium]